MILTTVPSSTSATGLVGCAFQDVGLPDNWGDGYCHDENNNEYCDDGGDCCGGYVLTSLCTLCECLHPGCPFPPFVG